MLTILYIIVPIGLAFFLWWYNSPEQKGKRGEKRVGKLLAKLPAEYHVLDDVVLTTNTGTTQIDHIVVSKYGVFAIETKNYRGEIYGEDGRQEWTQIITTDVNYRRKWWKTYTYVTKNHFYNPVKQSLAHVYAIKNDLVEWPYLKVIPIVVFAGNAILNNVQSSYHVIYDDNLLWTIQNYRSVCIPDNEVQKVIYRLTKKNVREKVDNRTHVSNINTAKYEQKQKIASGICPKCGGRLVHRNGRYGDFWGCSNYPKCKFTAR